MTFVTPALLAGTLLVAVPIVLHLIMRQQPRRLEFPALRFLQSRRESNTRRLRLRHLLLLALRCAAILLLALALARPSLRSGGWLPDQEAPVSAALVFDTGPRMEYRHQNQTRLEVAQETAGWLLEQFPPESEVFVLDSQPAVAAFPLDTASGRTRVDRLGITQAPQPLSLVLDEALRIVSESELKRKEVYVFTDLSRDTWLGEPDPRWKQRLAEAREAGVYVIDIGVPEPHNAAIGELELSDQAIPEGGEVRLTTTVIQAGGDGDRTVELLVADESGNLQKRGQLTKTLVGGRPEAVEFLLGGLPRGVHQGMVRLVGEDALPGDNARYFTIDVHAPRRILLAAPSPAEEYAFFVRLALEAGGFEGVVKPLEQLASEPLEDYAGVVLLDPTPLDHSVWRRLQEYASAGHGVAIFLGRNTELEAMNQPPAQALLPGKLERQWRAAGPLYLAPEAYHHPVLSAYQGVQGSVPWEDFPVQKYWRIDELNQGVAVVVPFSDNAPALLERPVGKGRVVTLTTSLSDDASDPYAWNYIMTGAGQSPQWPGFLLVLQTARYMIGASDERLNYYPREAAVVPLPEGQPVGMYFLSTPTGEVLRQSATGQEAITIGSTQWVGNYELRAGAEKGGLERGFSVNLQPEATRLERATPEELKKLFGDLPFRLARGRQEIDRTVNVGRVGLELYPLLIMLVALVVGLEYVLSNRFYRQPDAGSPAVGGFWQALRRIAPQLGRRRTLTTPEAAS